MAVRNWILAGVALSALTACNEIPGPAYYNRGDPENLLDLSSEVVTISLASNAGLGDLSDLVMQDPPTSADLGCNLSDPVCKEAKSMLDLHGVPYQFKQNDGNVTLVYERVVARDCENRYIDNSINPYNLHPLTYGCSITGNMVQMVSDKRQFTNPNLLEFQDGEKAAQTYGEYLKPASQQQDEGSESLVQSGVGGGS